MSWRACGGGGRPGDWRWSAGRAIAEGRPHWLASSWPRCGLWNFSHAWAALGDLLGSCENSGLWGRDGAALSRRPPFDLTEAQRTANEIIKIISLHWLVSVCLEQERGCK